MTMTNSWCLTGFKLSMDVQDLSHALSASMGMLLVFLKNWRVHLWIYLGYMIVFRILIFKKKQFNLKVPILPRRKVKYHSSTWGDKVCLLHITKISISFHAQRKMEILFKAHHNFILQVQHSTHWTQCFMNWQEGFYINFFGKRLRSNRMHATFESKFAIDQICIIII
jgi:hypothetical protein